MVANLREAERDAWREYWAYIVEKVRGRNNSYVFMGDARSAELHAAWLAARRRLMNATGVPRGMAYLLARRRAARRAR